MEQNVKIHFDIKDDDQIFYNYLTGKFHIYRENEDMSGLEEVSTIVLPEVLSHAIVEKIILPPLRWHTGK